MLPYATIIVTNIEELLRRAAAILIYYKYLRTLKKIFSLYTKYGKNTWYGKMRLTSYKLRVASYELRGESLKARVEIQKCKFKYTS